MRNDAVCDALTPSAGLLVARSHDSLMHSAIHEQYLPLAPLAPDAVDSASPSPNMYQNMTMQPAVEPSSSPPYDVVQAPNGPPFY